MEKSELYLEANREYQKSFIDKKREIHRLKHIDQQEYLDWIESDKRKKQEAILARNEELDAKAKLKNNVKQVRSAISLRKNAIMN